MGPTASGKTALAVDWCQALGTEVVSVDSALVYRGMGPRNFIDTVAHAARTTGVILFVIAAAAVFSVIRNASAPYGVSLPDAPNLSTTRWRVVADHKSMVFYGESATSPNVFWVDLKELDFSEDAPVQKLDIGVDMSRILAGEASSQFVPAEPFDFMEAE